MMMYQSMTTTRKNIAAIRGVGWGWLIAPESRSWDPKGMSYVLDNGAWSAFNSNIPWDGAKYGALVDRLGSGADFVIAPDIVAGGLESLSLSLSWLSRLSGLRLVAVQDGMEPSDLAPVVGPTVGIALGGSTEWKLLRMRDWGRFCRRHGCYYHVLRVNTLRRIRYAFDAGADSVDGSRCSRFGNDVGLLDNEIRQERLWKSVP